MEPSSGAPRPESTTGSAEPPTAAGVATDEVSAGAGAEAAADLSMSTAHLARFEFSDAGTKILMVEWLPGAAAASPLSSDAPAPAQGRDQSQSQASSQAQTPSQDHPSAVTPTPTSAPVSGLVAKAPSAPSALSAGGAASSASSPGRGSGPGVHPTRPGTTTVSAAAAAAAAAAGWEVSWPGKSTFLPARDADLEDSSSPDDDDRRRRVFFLLPPDAPVPPTVTITPPGRAPIKVKPLPAIFPEGFGGAEASRPGSRGVLHTIWAKKRLRELEREMEAELRANAESVGLEMAMAEKQWIVDSFLQPPRQQPPPTLDIGRAQQAGPGVAPLSPRSPTGRLGEKLKGLRLATSPADLVPSPTANTFTRANSQSQTLSPTEGDMAVSSFSAISRNLPGAAAPGGPAPAVSLNAALHGDLTAAGDDGAPKTDDDGLFALPMSPRSPDMKKSPFSIR